MSKVSVIIPTFKRPESLQRAIRSVLLQTHSDFELLIIDDDPKGSDAIDVAKSFGDSRILCLKNSRSKGGNGARNTGMLKASGPYISFLDDDDEYLSTRLETLVRYFSVSQCHFVCTAYYLKANSSKLIRNTFSLTLENFLTDKLFIGSSSNLILKRPNSISHMLWNESLPRHQDTEYVIRMMSKWRFGYVNLPLLIVNGHNGMPSAKVNLEAKQKLIASISPYLGNIAPNIRAYYFARLYRDLALAFERENNVRQMVKYLKISLSHKLLPPYKYLRFLISFR
jgi:glycosyltransferase involved in cell wall biosynthesis